MATWARSVLLTVAALLAASCGTMTSGPAAHGKAVSHQAAPHAAGDPVVSVAPDTGLAGGQPLRVTLTGFPPHSYVALQECAAVSACSVVASGAGTGSTGSASVTFIAQPSVLTGSRAAPVSCARQCFLDAVAEKVPGGVPPTPAPAATAPLAFAPGHRAAAPDLARSALLSVSWISPSEGWALATQPCATGSCARLARTTDAGRHWQQLPGPPATPADGTADCQARICVSQLSFASPAIGYLYGPALLMTTDGGLTWHAQPGPQTETLTVAGGQAYRVAYSGGGCPGPCQPALQQAPAGSASWRTVIAKLSEPDRSGSAQIAVSGPDVLVGMYGSLAGPSSAQAFLYRSTDGGSSWQRGAGYPCGRPRPGDPYGTEEDLTGLAAAPGGFFAGLCVKRASMRSFVVTSTDAGATWRQAAALPPGQGLGVIAAASPGVIAVASGATGGGGSFTAQLLVTVDGGRHWSTAATDTQDLTAGGAPGWAGFETPLAGQWLGDPHGVWTTTDGGAHWTRTPFR
jgi:photosystem II stability/assembly factor-like uncharacterized protein